MNAPLPTLPEAHQRPITDAADWGAALRLLAAAALFGAIVGGVGTAF